MRIAKSVLALGLVLMTGVVFAQVNNDYRTARSGEWTTLVTWERYNGSAWVTPTESTPTSTANVITIRKDHAITVSSKLSIDQTIVESEGSIEVTAGTLTIGGSAADPDMTCSGKLKVSGTGIISATATGLIMENGSEYEHARDSGSYPLATWKDGSTLLITGLTATNPGNSNQDFYNLSWNCAGQTADINTTSANYRTINGTCEVISTGSSAWQWTETSTGTKTFGSYKQSGGTVNMSGGTGSIEVYLNGDFVMSDGTLTLSEAASAEECGWNFQKLGTQSFNKSNGTISKTIYFNVFNGTTLDIVDGPITGAGNFTLNASASLIIRDAYGITTSDPSETAGAVQVSGSRSFREGANYIYQGGAAQVTGNAIPDFVSNLTIDNASGLSFSKKVEVSSVFTQSNGEISGEILPEIQGYSSPDYKRLKIYENGPPIKKFSASTETVGSSSNKVDRQWTLKGTFKSTKSVTFYWDATEDVHFNWEYLIPAVYIGSTKYTPTAYDISSEPRWVSVTLNSFVTTGTTYTIKGVDDGTLAVELSSFTAASSSYNNVILQWVTQSETNASGFRIYRHRADMLNSAQMLSAFIPATNTTQMKVYLFTDEQIQEEGLYYYWLENLDFNGESEFHGPIHINVAFAIPPPPTDPLVQGINSAYPNPFTSPINIDCCMVKDGQATVQIFNIRGQLIKTLFSGAKGKGIFRLQWDGTDQLHHRQPIGIYLIRMDSDNGKHLRRITLSN